MIGLLWRQFNQQRWPALLLALTVAMLATVAGVVPRLMSDLDDRQLGQTLASLSAAQGDITGSWAFDPFHSSVPLEEDAADPWAGNRTAGQAIREAQPEPLRTALAEPEFLSELNSEVVIIPPASTGYFRATFGMFVDPQLADHAELTAGAWPEMTESPRQVAMLDEAARKLGFTVGSAITDELVVAGLFTPLDPDDRRWAHVPYGRAFSEPVDPDRGIAMAAGLFLPHNYTLTADLGTVLSWDSSMTKRVWFGLEPDSLQTSGVDVAELGAQLTALLSQRQLIAPAGGLGQPPVEIRLNSELNTALTRVLSQQATTRSVLLVAAVGPIAVALALVVLAARLVIQRRAPWLELTHARGLTPEQARRLAAIEGLVLSVPAAAVGHLAALYLIPGPRQAISWLVAPLGAAVAPVALAVLAGRVGTRRTRTDLSPRAGRWRLVAEVLAVAVAAAATWQLLTRPNDTVREGLDLLGAATPVLWALAVSLLLLRLYPLPLRLLAGWFKGRPGLTAFLGAVRSLRDPAGGVVPIVTVLLGTTLAVMGATLLSTLTTGTERATWEDNGSHIHLSGPRMLEPLMEEVRAIEGVDHVARIYQAVDNVRLTHDDGEEWVRVLLADPEIVDVYAASPAGSPVPASMVGTREAIASSSLPRDVGTVTIDGIGELTVTTQIPTLPGARTGGAWVLTDRANWPLELRDATTALISVEPGADMRQVAEAVSLAVPNARVSDVSAQLDALRSSITVAGLSRAFLILAGATAVLMALGIVGSQLLAGGERNHLAAILRTLGLRQRQLRALTAWEVGPAIVLALVVGVALGIGMAALMLNSLDFRSLTGGEHPPELTLHWPTLGAVVGALLATSAVAVAVTSWVAGRTDVAQELRIGDQR